MSIPYFKMFFHGGAAGIILYGYNSLGRIQVYSEAKAQYGGFWQYLTIQGIFLAGLTMVVSLVPDFYPPANAARITKRLLLILSLPLNVVISSIYWPLVLFMPSMILQEAQELSGGAPSLDNAMETFFYVPLDIDLALHAVPAITLLLDFLLFEPKYSRKASKILAPFLALTYTLGYGWWVERCGARNDGIFPYPFLTNNPLNARLWIYGGAGLIAPLSFWLLNYLHS